MCKNMHWLESATNNEMKTILDYCMDKLAKSKSFQRKVKVAIDSKTMFRLILSNKIKPVDILDPGLGYRYHKYLSSKLEFSGHSQKEILEMVIKEISMLQKGCPGILLCPQEALSKLK